MPLRDSYDRLLNHLSRSSCSASPRPRNALTGGTSPSGSTIGSPSSCGLWEAIDQGFLVPFQYFGVADGTDLRQLTWRRGGYAAEDLSNLFTGDDVRVAKLLEAIQRIVLDPGQDARAGVLRLEGARALHGAQVHRGRACRASP